MSATSAQRKAIVLDILMEESSVGVADLSKRLNVTPVTARADLDALEKEGLLVRTHGGAVLGHHPKVFERMQANQASKRRVARAAADLIADGDTIIVSAGTTTALIARYLLGERDVHIVTNNTLLLNYARANPQLRVTLIGGEFQPAEEGTVVVPDMDSQFDPVGIGKAFLEMTQRMMANPAQVVESQTELWQSYMKLWETSTRKMMGEDVEPVASPDKSDKRFRHDEWSENFVFDYIKQSYLLASRWLLHNVDGTDFPDEHSRRKVDFYIRQFIDAMAPTNFVATNPQVLQETIDSRGENLTV